MTSIIRTALEDEVTAYTDSWTVDNLGLPTAASTEFYSPWVESVDPDRTTHHELLHGIGFSFKLALFSKHVDGSLKFYENDNKTGKVLGILTRIGGTHLDDNERNVNGFDQSDSVMSPFNIVRQRMGNQEKQILDSAFKWSANGLKISAIFDGAFTDAQKKSVQNAIDAANKLFGSAAAAHAFQWKVKVSSSNPSLGQIQSPA